MSVTTAPAATEPVDRAEQLRQAHEIGVAMGTKLDALTFASIDDVQAGYYPTDADTDDVIRSLYDGIRVAVRTRTAARAVAVG